MEKYTLTVVTVLSLVILYACLFIVIRMLKSRVEKPEVKTYVVVGLAWAILVFFGNYGFYKLGIMSFLPWLNNFLHTFVWIGGCLTLLYLAIRDRQSMFVQFVAFATFSLVVKYAENLLFGTWDLDHFFHLFEGNTAYIIGWSLADGLYPIITLFGLRLMSKFVPGLIAM